MAVGSKAVFAFAIVSLITVTEQTNVLTPCPTLASQKDFDINQFLGMWKVYATPVGTNECLSYDFNYKEGNAGPIIMTYQYSLLSDFVSYNVTIAEDSDDPGSYTVVSGPNRASLRVVQTDYVNYAVLLRCFEFLNNSISRGFILLTRTPGSITENEVAEIYSTYNIPNSSMNIVNHDRCSPTGVETTPIPK